jgi:hypothetical protein
MHHSQALVGMLVAFRKPLIRFGFGWWLLAEVVDLLSSQLSIHLCTVLI